MEDVVHCEACGEEADKYFNSFPICSNPVCFQVRLDFIKKMIEEMNKKVEDRKNV